MYTYSHTNRLRGARSSAGTGNAAGASLISTLTLASDLASGVDPIGEKLELQHVAKASRPQVLIVEL
jgi:hypothetical protein